MADRALVYVRRVGPAWMVRFVHRDRSARAAIEVPEAELALNVDAMVGAASLLGRSAHDG